MKKIEIRVLEPIEQQMIAIAIREFDGNLSSYVRDLIFKDLRNRQVEAFAEKLKNATQK